MSFLALFRQTRYVSIMGCTFELRHPSTWLKGGAWGIKHHTQKTTVRIFLVTKITSRSVSA